MYQQTKQNAATPCRYQELLPEMAAFLTEYLEYGRRNGLEINPTHISANTPTAPGNFITFSMILVLPLFTRTYIYFR